MRRAPNAGTNRELKVMHVLADEGWLCASRRHIGGAGDVLAIKGWNIAIPSHGIEYGTQVRALLIEVKSTTRSPWVAFGPKDRHELTVTAEKYGAEAWLYHWPPRGKLHRIPAADFPKSVYVEPEDLPGHGTVETQAAPFMATLPEDEDIARDLPPKGGNAP